MLVGNTDNEAGYYNITAYGAGVKLNQTEWNRYNLASFTCPSARAARSRISSNTPTWRYRYYGEFPNSILYEGSGAYHGSDIPQILGTAEDISSKPNTENENRVSAYMMRVYASFARNPPSGLQTELGWPPYVPEGRSHL